MLDRVIEKIDAVESDRLKRLFEFMRIDSISTDPAFDESVAKAAQWLQNDISSIGFTAEVIRTTGHPMVYGEYLNAPGQPTVLFYGHYDVQPVDPLELWERDPFDPAIKDGKIIGRGSSDDKGQLMTFVEACRAYIEETGGLPINVKIIAEGEEESGSPSLDGFMEAHKSKLTADVALICDTGMWDENTGAITTRLRGLVHQEVTITCADQDLHSGFFGGLARNPIHLLSSIIAQMHDPDTGAITLPGFYDGVVTPSAETLADWKKLEPDFQELLHSIDLKQAVGENEYSLAERGWSRPTLDVNGIFGGYTGAGTKTVIPSQATAKISMRMVPGQDPDQISTSFRQFVEARLPADCSAEFSGEGSGALLVPEDNPFLAKARGALDASFPNPSLLIGCGGSIPIAGTFQRELGIDSLFIGFGLNDDRIHSPNEKYNLSSFNGGARTWARVLDALQTAR